MQVTIAAPRTVVFFLLAVYGCLVNLVVFDFPFSVFVEPDVDAIASLEFIESDATSPSKLPDDNWRAISLPDDWQRNARKSDLVWYRSHYLFKKTNESIWAVYLPTVTHNAAVFINDTWVGQGGSFTKPISRNQNKPLLFSFSNSLLHDGDNTIKILVGAEYWKQGLFDKFYIGPLDKLEPAYKWKYLIRYSLIQWITVSMLFMALMVFSFWLARKKDIVYALFTLELIIWSLHNLNLFFDAIPFSAPKWEALNIMSMGWTVVVMIFFNHRFVGSGSKIVEKFLLLYSAAGLSILFLGDVETVLYFGYKFWYPSIAFLGAYALIHVMIEYWHHQNRNVLLMLFVGTPIMIMGSRDVLLVNGYLDRTAGLIVQYSVIPALILFGWFLIGRFVESIEKAEELAATLEDRVKQKQNEIHQQYEKINVFEKQRMLADERERIMRDMHDGIGGQLVSIVALLHEHQGNVFDRVREKVKSSLADLRFVIDSLDPVMTDLPTLLGMMRHRLRDQLLAKKIELDWQVTELPDVADMSPKRCLHVMRIVQESITNIVKHSQATNVIVQTGLLPQDQSRIFIDIIDNGKGIDSSSFEGGGDKSSRGISNMRYRAKEMHSELNIDSLEVGTRVRILFNIKNQYVDP